MFLNRTLTFAATFAAALLVLTVALGSAGARGDFHADLAARAVVEPVESAATGRLVLRLAEDGRRLHCALILANIENVRAAHIHLAPAGAMGPAVAAIYPGPRIDGRFNGLLAEGELTAADLLTSDPDLDFPRLLAELRAGRAYVKITTDRYPGGEIRGQIN